jgi:3D (Asp-Asp-Asp) domain-containing protein
MQTTSALKNTGRAILALSGALILSGLGIYARSLSAPDSQSEISYNTQENTFHLQSPQQPEKKIIQPETVSQETKLPAILAEPNVGPQHPMLNPEPVISSQKMAVSATPKADDAQAPKKFHATAYALHGTTASGSQTRRGVIAADPKILPLGSVVQVRVGQKYSGVYTVHDTGRLIKGKLIDIWMPSNKEARRFGRQPVKLVVLKYGARGRKK